MLLANILLAIAWAALQGVFSLSNLLIGYFVGYLVLAALARGGVVSPNYRRKVHAVLSLAVFLLRAFIVANIRMAIDVLRSKQHLNPGIVGVPLDATADHEILMLAIIINLTPGTIALDVSADRKTLYLHVMHVSTAEAIRAEIKNSFERRVLEVLR